MKNVTYINAGAGSGKTYTLTTILADRLSDKENCITPSQVILTTFTELAATEFREKARQQILAKGNAEIAAQMDSAIIGTVHSVAFAFIKKYWYLLEYGADVQTISERDADFYMSQSLAGIVKKEENAVHLKNFRRFRDCFNIVDAYSHPDYFFWQRYLNNIVEKMEYYNVNDIEESIEKSIETVRAVYCGRSITDGEVNALKGYLKSYYDYILTKTTSRAEKQRAPIKKLLNFNEIIELLELYKREGMITDPVGGKTKIEKECPGYADFCERLDSMLVSSSYLVVIEGFIRSIFAVAKEWRDDFVKYKRENHIISYNDMERIFLRLLEEESEVQEYVRDNFRIVMVDEFQDSNPIQLKIFNRLSEIIAESDGHSYWVGDPKQAIYGFRGADTDLVNAVSSRFKFYDDDKIHPEEKPDNLGTGRLVKSWRSRKALVELVNNVFGELFERDGINKLCIKLTPQFTAPEHEIEAPAVVYIKNSSDDALAMKVKAILDSKMPVHQGRLDEAACEIAPRDIAILCRKNDNCKKVVDALRKYGIPVSEPEDAIMQRIEVQLVVSILQFVQEPDSKFVIANLLRLLWGRTTEDILKERLAYLNVLKDKDAWMQDSPEYKELIALKDDVKHLSIPEMVRAVIYKIDLPHLVARWGDAGIRRQNLSTLQHIADDYDRMCLQMGMGTSISGFIYYLDSIEPDKEKDNKSNTVKVLTYHSSKGLEWPVVIMKGLENDALSESDMIRRQFMCVREIVKDSCSDDPFAREYYLRYFPCVLSGKTIPSLLQKNIVSLASYGELRKRVESEERRLLYVGMTRAKDCIYTIEGSKNKYKWLKNIGIENSKSENVWGCYPSSPVDIADVLPDDAASSVAAYSMVLKPAAHDAREVKYLSPSKIEAFDGFSGHSLFLKGKRGITCNKWKEEKYAGIGSCIHDIFAVYRRGAEGENTAKARSVIDGYGLAAELDVLEILQSADWLHCQLQEQFPQRAGDRTYNEYDFGLRLDGGRHLRGEMDLLWFYTDEKGEHCVLVDYKTSPGTDIDEHVKKYYAQLSAYAHALRTSGVDVTHTLVYYPVQERIVRLH